MIPLYISTVIPNAEIVAVEMDSWVIKVRTTAQAMPPVAALCVAVVAVVAE